MPRLNPVQSQALGYWWNLIVDAVQIGFTTTETTALASQVARDLGGTVSFDESKAIATLYGYAKRMDNAARDFQAASPDALITPNMVATAPYARSEQEMAAYPTWHVKFYYEYIDQAGNQQVAVRTSVIPLTLGPTVADVQANVLTDAEAFAAKYGHQLVGATAFQIVAV